MEVYPSGESPEETDIYFHVHLFDPSVKKIDVSFSYRLNSKYGRNQANILSFDADGGAAIYVDRRYLEEDGSLELEMTFELSAEEQLAVQNRRVWFPKIPPENDFLRKLYDEQSEGEHDTSDVTFLVENKNIPAHMNVLAYQCRKLYDIAKEGKSDEPIPIPSIRSKIFGGLLNWIYSGELTITTKENAMDLLIASDLFEVTDLKLYAESVLIVDYLDIGTAASLFVFADSHSCALLKEAATKTILSDLEKAKKSEGWPQLHESREILVELLESAAKKAPTDDDEAEELDVTTLRENLEAAGLELDGSREVLLSRWKNHLDNHATNGGGSDNEGRES